MKIFVDMDNTACNFIKAFAEKCNELYRKDFNYQDQHLYWEKDWEITKTLFPFSTEVERKSIHTEVFNSPGFWLGMEPMPYAVESIRKISQDNQVYILTAPYPTSIGCWIEKFYWVKKNLPFIKTENMVYCSDKSLLKSDIIIDDKPAYLDHNQFAITIAYEYGFNRHLKSKVEFMADDWRKIADFIEKERHENRNK